jgi:stringent starvation protein B
VTTARAQTSTKPYLIRAIYEWCADNNLTPYLHVRVDRHTQVPMAYVKNGEITLNIGASATQHLQLGNQDIEFHARFGGVAHKIYIPIHAVAGIFARETGQGRSFEPQEPEPPPTEASATSAPQRSSKPQLRIVK